MYFIKLSSVRCCAICYSHKVLLQQAGPDPYLLSNAQSHDTNECCRRVPTCDTCQHVQRRCGQLKGGLGRLRSAPCLLLQPTSEVGISGIEMLRLCHRRLQTNNKNTCQITLCFVCCLNLITLIFNQRQFRKCTSVLKLLRF